jgi:hypothetical protein
MSVVPSGLDATARATVDESVSRVLADELYWLPIRHHSPLCARHVEQAIRERKPKVVFIEGPKEASELVRFVVDPRTKPPVALYSAYRVDTGDLPQEGEAPGPVRVAAWYPLLSYSPEYVAMLTASAVGAEVELIDLPHAALMGPPSVEEAEGPETSPSSDHFYDRLAAAAGFRTWAQAWDGLFEFGPGMEDRESFRLEMTTFCAAARSLASNERLAADGTLARERFMWRAIEQGLKQRGLNASQAMVVCGGFHVFMDRHDPVPPPSLPPGTPYSSVVPYSFFRVSELSGYAAGNHAPQFYQSVWDMKVGETLHDLQVRHIVSVLRQARRQGESLSAADAISVAHHARLLAGLRRRETPILDDLQDAVMSCCCKGEPERYGRQLREAMDKVAIGNRIGTVTPDAGRLPLVDDFYLQLSSHRLSEVTAKEKRITLRLDKRDEDERRRSAFLHRLAFLSVPMAEKNHAQEGMLFAETWQVRWSPEVETKLIECGALGDTVEAAALAHLRERLVAEKGHAGATASRLRAALEMELPSLVDEIQNACGLAVDSDARFLSLSEALRHLQVLRRHLALGQISRTGIQDLLEQCFDRACFALPESANAPEEDHEQVVEGLRVIGELLLSEDADALDRNVFIEHVNNAIAVSGVPFLRGAFLGMLAELRVISPEALSLELRGHALRPVQELVTVGEFLDGVLASCRTSLLLDADRLVGAVDDLLRAADHEPFLMMLPRLRTAFSRLHARQRQSLSDHVVRRYGLSDRDQVAVLTTSVAAGAMLARLDGQAGRILAEWGL